MNDTKYLTVAALNRYLKAQFDNDPNLRTVFLKGEISNAKRHTTGHIYFSIKDETSKINAIMFNNSASKLMFDPVDGKKVLVTGRISVYEATGAYQIYVESMDEDGVGNLYIAFEKLKQDLTKEGLFDNSHKKTLPKYPKRIGIVTAATGAAVKDIISTIKRRFPITETILFPSLVQGESAASDITRNIAAAQNYELDILIVGRGGGSIEDLWPFNEEIVARAIYDSKVPIISAVGHEVDYTIADYVADLRAPTPTGAAEIAVPHINDVINHINQLKIRLNESVFKTINYQKLYLDSIKNSYVIKSPLIMFDNKKQNLDIIVEKLNRSIVKKIDDYKTKIKNYKNNYLLNHPDELFKNNKNKLMNIIDKLELVSPLKVLKRGYSITYNNGIVVKTIKDIKLNETINIKISDGIIDAKIVNIKGE